MLAKALALLTPEGLEFSFFCNSGTEAVEGALKLARAYDPRKQTIVAATKRLSRQELRCALGQRESGVPPPVRADAAEHRARAVRRSAALRDMMTSCKAVGEDVGAVLLEPIQGEGGVNIPDDDYLPGVRALCDEFGSLLILDEVQTGMGRTGKMFCCEHYGVSPDLMCLAKAFGGGVVPAGAVIGRREIFSRLFDNPFLHTSTFGGNPLACAAALATINVLIEDKLPERAAVVGARLLAGLREAARGHEDFVLDVRGKGLLIALEFHDDESGYDFGKRMLERGVLVSGTLVNARTIRVEPPLTILDDEADYVCPRRRGEPRGLPPEYSPAPSERRTMQTSIDTAARAAEILRNLPRRDGAVPMYVNGAWRSAADGATRELFNPADGRAIVSAAEGNQADAQAAIEAARAAFDEGPWSATSAADRAALLFRVADAIDARRDELSQMDTLNGGKPLRETEFDVIDAANCFRYYAGLATKPHGQTFDVPAPSQSFTVREPIGVCGQIVPWNYPLLMAVWKIAPALAAGNVCILKPAELTPLSAILLAQIFHDLELPAGVLNVVLGPGASVGHALAASEAVDKIAFTGGTKTGRSIMQAATSNLKKISLELGGKSPNVVFADADFETAIDYALFGIFANAGQSCSAGSRLVVERSLRRSLRGPAGRTRGEDPRRRRVRPLDGDGPDRLAAPSRARRGIHRRGRCGRSEVALRRQPPGRRACGRKLHRADDLRRHDALDAHRSRRDFRPGARGPDFRRRSRCDPNRKRHDLRARRRGLHAGRRKGASRDPEDARGHHLDQHVSSHVQRSAVGRLKQSGIGRRARHVRLRGVHGGQAGQREPRRRALGLVLGLTRDVRSAAHADGLAPASAPAAPRRRGGALRGGVGSVDLGTAPGFGSLPARRLRPALRRVARLGRRPGRRRAHGRHDRRDRRDSTRTTRRRAGSRSGGATWRERTGAGRTMRNSSG